MNPTYSPRQLIRHIVLLLAIAALSACSGSQPNNGPGLLGYGTPGVSSYGQAAAATTLREELDRCASAADPSAASQTQGLAAACSQLKRTARNQPGNTLR